MFDSLKPVNINQVTPAHVYDFYDTHAHLDFPPFIEDFPATIGQFQHVGVRRVMIPAVTRDKFAHLLTLAHQYPSVIAIALGLHPLYIESHTEADLETLAIELQQDNAQISHKIKAIGEIGLDAYLPYLLETTLFNKQVDFLQKQLMMANQYDLPVILHSRRTHAMLLNQLKSISVNRCGVIHGFSGSFEEAKAFVALGYKIGVGGTITYPRANKTRTAISKLPLECLLLETDAPDMPIFGRQGTVNRSDYLVEIFNVLCELRKESPDEIANQVWQTSNELFYE